MEGLPPRAPRFAALSRVIEWFWRGRALAEATRDAGEAPAQLAEARARVTAEVGQHALEPSTPWVAGTAHVQAASLLLESIGWSLRAESSSVERSAVATGPCTPAELTALLHEHEALLLRVAEPSVIERLRVYAATREFEDLRATPADADLAARALAKVSRGLLRARGSARVPTDRLLAQRVARTGGVALMIGASLALAPSWRDWRERRADLAAGKPWAASSTYQVACQSPAKRCDSATDFFFHTKMESRPWLEVDLGASRAFSGVRVSNRRDCCDERAVPLLVEVSDDGERWRTVARRDQTFRTWRARFATQNARWVRLRVDRDSYLHLKDVLVLP